MTFTPCLSAKITVLRTIFTCLSRPCKKLKLKQANRLRKCDNILYFAANVTKLAINTTLIKKEPNLLAEGVG